MREIYRNPMLYYILVPLLIALWPLFVWGVYIPRVDNNWKHEKSQYNKAEDLIIEILTLDPDRLGFADPQNNEVEFDYARAIERVATLCRIPPTNYKISSGMIIGPSGGQKSQSAHIVLKELDITRFAKFLSTIQLRWANLQCTKIKLTKKKGLPDSWEADLDFKYYF